MTLGTCSALYSLAYKLQINTRLCKLSWIALHLLKKAKELKKIVYLIIWYCMYICGCVTGELKVSQSKRTYLITMSTFQMAMLLMFEKVRYFSVLLHYLVTQSRQRHYLEASSPWVASKP